MSFSQKWEHAVKQQINSSNDACEFAPAKGQEDFLTATLSRILAAKATPAAEAPDMADKLMLTSYRPCVSGGEDDLAFIIACVTDQQGRTCPDADCPVTFTAAGGEILGTANGDAADPDPQPRRICRAFRGLCVAYVRPDGKGDALTVRAEAPGLMGAAVTLPAACK